MNSRNLATRLAKTSRPITGPNSAPVGELVTLLR
jgi:hypothetical protein